VIELLAHAKLTWNLEILGRREDGLHDLRSEMTTIGLHDVLFVDDSADHLEVLNPFTTDVVSGEDNLIVRALRLVGRRAGVRVEKSIPIGGGLGGGSADAAAILRWAGECRPRSRSRSGVTCRSASTADAPSSKAWARWSKNCPMRNDA